MVANDDPITSGSALPSHDDGASNSRRNAQISPAVARTYTHHVPGTSKNPSGKLRQLSEKEWDDLKDILYKHYIQENETVRNTIKIMREKHDVFLT